MNTTSLWHRTRAVLRTIALLIGAAVAGAAPVAIALALAAWIAEAQSPRPHPASDPAAVALHERHVRVSGTATPPAFQHFIMEMRIGDGPVMRTESYAAQPNRILVRTTVGGAVAMEFGYDGTTGWNSSPQTGLIRLDSAGVDALRGSASFGTAPALDPSAKQRAIGRSTFDDQLVDGVRVVLASGDSADIYYAISTGLMAGLQLRSTSTPAANMTIMLRDYKRVDGRMEHTTSVMRGGGMEMVARMTHLDHEPIDAGSFNPSSGVPPVPPT